VQIGRDRSRKDVDTNVKERLSERAVMKEKWLGKCPFNKEDKHQRELS